MSVKQVFIVRRDSTERFRALQETFGAPPISAKIIWDRRHRDRRRRARLTLSDRRRAERRGPIPGSWSALDFLVTRPTGVQPAVNGSGSIQGPANPVDGDLLLLRETSVNVVSDDKTPPSAVSVVVGRRF